MRASYSSAGLAHRGLNKVIKLPTVSNPANNGCALAFRTINQPQLPTELQEGAEHAQESTNNLLVYFGFFCPQGGDVHSR